MFDFATVAVIVIVLYPFVVLLTAKLAAYGWFRGKQEYNKQQQEIFDGDTKSEEEA